MERFLSRIVISLIYQFQQEAIPCSPVLYTILKNYVPLSNS